jgi:hypothetical protein
VNSGFSVMVSDEWSSSAEIEKAPQGLADVISDHQLPSG